MNVLCNGHAVFEIKGAPCTRCAYFSCRVHIFETCAPGVCMILSNYKEVFIVSNTLTVNTWLGAPFLVSLHPAGAQNRTLISNTGHVTRAVGRGSNFFPIGMGVCPPFFSTLL